MDQECLSSQLKLRPEQGSKQDEYRKKIISIQIKSIALKWHFQNLKKKSSN